jgi:hypothetical protein
LNINQLYPSTFLKSDDIGQARPTVTIAKITLEDMGNKEMKPVLHFLNKDKGLVLNKTNGFLIAQAFGEETDTWPGKSIQLYSHMVNFQGKMVAGIAVVAPAPQAQQYGPEHAINNPPLNQHQPGQPPVEQSAGHQPQPSTLAELNKQPAAHQPGGPGGVTAEQVQEIENRDQAAGDFQDIPF